MNVIILMGLAVTLAVAAAYMFGEWRGSHHYYEPIHVDQSKPEPIAWVGVLEDQVTVDYIPALSLEGEGQHVATAALAVRYRREALVWRKRFLVLMGMLLAPRRPARRALEVAVVEVKGRELPLVPPAIVSEWSEEHD